MQIKGRDFEIPACGGFLLTQENPELCEYFEPGREIAVYGDTEDLIDKIGFYLSHDEERERVRAAGYRRFLRDHTMLGRLEAIFARVLPDGRIEPRHPAEYPDLPPHGNSKS